MRLEGSVVIKDYTELTRLHRGIAVLSLYSAHGEDFLLVRYPSKAGIKYKLSPENLTLLLIGIPCQRRLTVRLKEPPHELIVCNHKILIRSFGNLVKFLCKPVGPSQIVRPPHIQQQLQPFVDIQQNMKVLKLHNIQMDYLPDEVAGLQQLTQLEVVNSNLLEIPEYVGFFPFLTMLNLSHNRLGVGSNWDFLASPLMEENLKQLDLQNNEICTLPNEVVKLRGLLILHVDYNLLTSLPTAAVEMTNLRVFTVSNNRMRIFPYNLYPLDSFSLDLSNNPFISHYFVRSTLPQNYDVLTLKELAGRVVANHSYPKDWKILPKPIYEYLRTHDTCEICGGAYFETFFPCRFIAYSRIYAEIARGSEGLYSVYDVRNLCSRRCMHPELKFCEVLNHLTPDEYQYMVRNFC